MKENPWESLEEWAEIQNAIETLWQHGTARMRHYLSMEYPTAVKIIQVEHRMEDQPHD